MHIEEFCEYIKRERAMSKNTLAAYEGDVREFQRFIEKKGVDVAETTKTEVVSFLLYLKEEQKSPATINRKLASLRGYYGWLLNAGQIKENPTRDIKAPKVERKEIDYLSIEEVNRLIEVPGDTLLGKRDRAILELLYGTGIRVNEIVPAQLDDVNLRIGFFTCNGQSGKARIIPLGGPARKALEEYIYRGRNMFIKDNSDEKTLFVNYFGKQMTRQGLWKILKDYGVKAGIEKRITPHILRNSFAVHMIQNGADLKSLQELLGHEDPAATQIYLSVTKNRIKDVYDKTHPRA